MNKNHFCTQPRLLTVADTGAPGQTHCAPPSNRGYTAVDRRVLVGGDLAGDETGTDGLTSTSRTRLAYRLTGLGTGAILPAAMVTRRRAARWRGGGPGTLVPN
jgi:hypothetical protein